MEKRIVDFIKKHHVLTLATSKEGQPWCAQAFYTFVEGENWLVFSSDKQTRHIGEVADNPLVGASIVWETSVVGKLQGIQISGTLHEAKEEDLKKAGAAYMRRFPFTVLMETTLWILEIHHLKMTDNRLGFGKKLIWDNPKFI
jgi:uncharacterized protein YhbP (UPF0306 family)